MAFLPVRRSLPPCDLRRVRESISLAAIDNLLSELVNPKDSDEKGPRRKQPGARRGLRRLPEAARFCVGRRPPRDAREVCVRTGTKAFLKGSISRLGTQYVVGLEAVNCNTGDTLAKGQAEASSKEGVLKTRPGRFVDARPAG